MRSFSAMWRYSKKAAICKTALNKEHQAAPCSQTSQLLELRERHLCYLSHPGYGPLLQQPELTKTEIGTDCGMLL